MSKRSVAAIVLLGCGMVAPGLGASGPFDGEKFQGRIAWSADGNHNDEDDWAASPVALAIFAAFGVKEQLVHFDYNSILNNNDPEWARTHRESVLGAVEKFGYDPARFFDDGRDLEGALENLTRAIDASSAEDPLYLVIAGPMEVAYRAIQRSDPAKRKHVYAVSHSRWNDGYDADYVYNYSKRNVIPSGVTWVQIRDQNAFLSTSPFGRPANAEEWAPFHWLRDAADAKLRFLWQRLRVSTRADCSDAGMAYFLMSGDEESEIAKVRALLEEGRVPAPLDPRPVVRIEAENFVELDGLEVVHDNRDRQVSHRIHVRGTGAMRTPFAQPYTAREGRYDAAVRYRVDGAGQARFSLRINGRAQGKSWGAGAGGEWATHTIAGVEIQAGDELELRVEARGEGAGRVDYVELRLVRPR